MTQNDPQTENFVILLPELEDQSTEGLLVAWLVGTNVQIGSDAEIAVVRTAGLRRQVVLATGEGTVIQVLASPGDTVRPGQALIRVAPRTAASAGQIVPSASRGGR